VKGAASDPLLRCRLRLPAPYDVAWVLGFLGDRAAPALERVGAAGLVRVVRLAGVPIVLELRFAPDPAAPRWVAVEARPGTASLAPSLRRLVRRMLDLDTDLAPFLALARRDPLLAPLAARHPGLRLPQLPDPFEGAVRAIVGQQVSVAGARTMIDRLARGLGEPLPGTGGLFAFPPAAALAAARPERIAALGFTRAKAGALIAVAAATAGGALDWRRLRAASPASAEQALVALPGIGPWTASYIRMRALGDRDAFPASDLGVIKALAAHAAPADIPALAERWRPFRAYAAIQLWRSLSP
jgi:AraC family transcriptional regulator, regulatory protein of adaptative response / DNA-3-methyladenine glycosylase II